MGDAPGNSLTMRETLEPNSYPVLRDNDSPKQKYPFLPSRIQSDGNQDQNNQHLQNQELQAISEELKELRTLVEQLAKSKMD